MREAALPALKCCSETTLCEVRFVALDESVSDLGAATEVKTIGMVYTKLVREAILRRCR